MRKRLPFIMLLVILALFGSKTLGRPRAFIAFLDVGQGDATLIQLADNTTILVDAGPDRSVLEQIDRALPFFDRTIELAVVTHPDTDHYMGFSALLNRYAIKHFWIASEKPGLWEVFTQEIKERGISIERPVPGSTVQLTGDASLNVLWPSEGYSDESNAMSIVLDFRAADFSYLLTGDAPIEVEQQLIMQYPDLHAAVLKLGHHGSRTSSAPEFFEALRPEMAVISSGTDNRFGHPHAEVLQMLSSQGIPHVRTDHFGSIIFFLANPLHPVHLDKLCLFC